MDGYVWHWEIVRGCGKEAVGFGVTVFGRLNIAFSKTSLNIRKFTVHVLKLKPGLENFEHYFTSV